MFVTFKAYHMLHIDTLAMFVTFKAYHMLHIDTFLTKDSDMKWFVAKALPYLLCDKQDKCDCVEGLVR
jgi:hypothetical protein